MPIRIESLISDEAPLRPDMRAGSVIERFLADSACSALPVVFQRTVLGVALRDRLLELALRIGREAFDDLPLKRIVDPNPVIAESGTPIGQVARMVADAGGKGFRRGVLVTHGGAYYGYVPPAALTRELTAENTRRAHQLKLAARKIEGLRSAETRAEKTGHEALSRLAHEVRTPLTALLGHAELLARADIPQALRHHADVLMRSSEALADLVTRSIEAGQAGAGAIEFAAAPFSLRAVAAELEALWRAPAEAKGLAFRLDVPRQLPDRAVGDASRLRQVLSNLLSNAVKYTRKGEIGLSLSACEREEGQLGICFRVHDTGPGISPEHAAKLFQPFQRLPGAETERGTGLGLNIARGLAEAMGGSLTYSSNPGGGSAFEFRVQLKSAGPRLAVRGPAGGTRRQRHITFQLGTILLIEDHPASQAVIQSTLKSAGWKVDTVDTLTQADYRAGHVRYQAILCDYHLRDGTGDLFLRRLRAMPGPNRNTLCLAVTADASEARRQHCLAVGFTGVITKPIRSLDLVTELADYIASDTAGQISVRKALA